MCSSHNNSLAAVAVAAARKHGVLGASALQAVGIPGDADTVSYLLLGLAAEKFPADAATDAMAYFVKRRQMSDGRWQSLAHRPPIESSEIQVTAISLRALQLYGIKVAAGGLRKIGAGGRGMAGESAAARHAGSGLPTVGTGWTAARKEATQSAANALVKGQRPDGGWAQTAAPACDAYATGQVARQESGTLKASDPACARTHRYQVTDKGRAILNARKEIRI
ncbi:MAG: hypothetical protein HYZ37_17305 [Candidatus Solibacter usitatus]|nr:hypothetical protein [Candidatus Solibacter usitatus]